MADSLWIPYGVSNFKTLRTQGCYYVVKSQYVLLEEVAADAKPS